MLIKGKNGVVLLPELYSVPPDKVSGTVSGHGAWHDGLVSVKECLPSLDFNVLKVCL